MSSDLLLARTPRLVDPLRGAIGDYLLALRSERKSPKTIRNYGDILERFRRFAGPVAPADLDARLVRRWAAALADAGLSGTTQHTYLTRLKTFVLCLETEEAYDVDAGWLRKVRKPALDTEQPDPLTDEEILRLFAACRARTWMGLRTWAILAVLLDAGLRRAELCGLTLGDVDLEAGEITVRAETSKSRRQRTIPLGAKARREVNRWWRGKRCQLDDAPVSAFFQGWNERPMSPDTLYHHLLNHGRRAGVPNAHPHRFRHTFARNCVRAGMNPLTLKELLGHRRMAMTERYIKWFGSEELLAEKRDKSPLDQLKGRW